MKKVQFAQSLYQGLPVSTVTGSTATTGVQAAGQVGSQMQSVYDKIKALLPP